eukprot:Clim_evm12s55 gene=Clim_evmTU12s55
MTPTYKRGHRDDYSNGKTKPRIPGSGIRPNVYSGRWILVTLFCSIVLLYLLGVRLESITGHHDLTHRNRDIPGPDQERDKFVINPARTTRKGFHSIYEGDWTIYRPQTSAVGPKDGFIPPGPISYVRRVTGECLDQEETIEMTIDVFDGRSLKINGQELFSPCPLRGTREGLRQETEAMKAQFYGMKEHNAALMEALGDEESEEAKARDRDLNAIDPFKKIEAMLNKQKDDNPAPCHAKGMAVLVLHEETLEVQYHEVFDATQGAEMLTVVKKAHQGRILVFMSYDDVPRSFLNEDQISQLCEQLGFREVFNFDPNGHYMSIAIRPDPKRPKVGYQYKEVHVANFKGEYPDPVSATFCVGPPTYRTSEVKKIARIASHGKLQNFCTTYNDFGYVCNESFARALLSGQQRRGLLRNPVSHAKLVYITSGGAHKFGEAFVEFLLETDQDPSYILVLHSGHEAQAATAAFVEAVGAHVHFIDPVDPKEADTEDEEGHKRYVDAQSMLRAIDYAFETAFPDSEDLVFVEENVCVGADVLTYFGQLHKVLRQNKDVIAIGTFNENSFIPNSSDESATLLSESFSRYAFMTSRSQLRHIQDALRGCCVSNSWDRAITTYMREHSLYTVLPAISRSYVSAEFHADTMIYLQYFAFRHLTSEADLTLANIDALASASAYEEYLSTRIRSGHILKDVSPCKTTSVLPDSLLKAEPAGTLFVLLLANDTTMKHFIICHAMWDRDDGMRSIYKGVLRFSLRGREIWAITKDGPFGQYFPDDVVPYTLPDTVSRPIFKFGKDT